MRLKNGLASLTGAALVLSLRALGPTVAAAGPFDLPEEQGGLPVHVSGLFDVRYARTSVKRGWLQGGSNKLRYGGRDVDNNGSGDRSGHVLAVPQASIVMDVAVPSHAKLHVQLNLDVDTDAQSSGAGIIEAYGDIERRFEPLSARMRLGAFIPPVSWEHPDAAWSTRHTLTPSAIGSWISEDIRAVGAEAALEVADEGRLARLTGGLFGGNDQAAWVLVDRGWALHDYQTDLNGRLRLPNGKVVQRPFADLDGRPGAYARVDFGLGDDLLRFGGGWWDNRADPDEYSLDGTTGIALWATHFVDFRARLKWRRWTFLSQHLTGSTSMPAYARRRFDSWYLLAAVDLGRFGLSGRFDRFIVSGWEDGSAVTAGVHWNTTLRQRLSAEYIHATADPNAGARPRAQRDDILQLNYRFRFGSS